jgi:hypothetical protein
MKPILSRIKRAGVREIAYRCREKSYVAAEAVQFAAGAARWREDRLRSRLLPSSPALAQARDALGRQHRPDAAAAVRSHFLQRARRFVIAPADREALSAAIRDRFPSSVEHASARAARILHDEHDLLGYQQLSFRRAGADVDWHFDPVHGRHAPLRFWARVPYLDAALGDHKVIWELNRHQHWLALGRAAWLTGEHRYAAAVADDLQSWMRANPPLTGINWSSMLELAFRSISWIWALHFLAPFEEAEHAPTWILDLLVGLDRQLDHIARHLSVYFSPNTHLLGEGLALYIGGRVLPELRSAARWERIGRAILVHEARAQVHEDGGHAELSTHYHRYALDFYLLALAVARITSDPEADHFAEVALRLASFCRAVADEDGRLPVIGDDDGGQLFALCGRSPAEASNSLAIAATLLERPELAVGTPSEEVFWICGEPAAVARPSARPPASRLFPDTGYVVLRSRASHGVFDGGRHGFLNGGHAHADALSLVLSVGGRSLLIDPGAATYTTHPEVRDWFRSTAMHNTVVIDGLPQAVPDGPFHWKSRADAQVNLWRSGGAFDFVEAQHDGYLPLVHRRAVLRTAGDLWVIADHVLGTGDHNAAAHWHFDPSWMPDTNARANPLLVHADGFWAAIASTAGNRQEFLGDAGGLGWCAPVYGQRVPSFTLRFSQSGDAPLSLVTAVAAAASPFRLSVEPTTVVADRDDGWHRTAALIEYGDKTLLAFFATPCACAHERRRRQRIALWCGELATDARAAVLEVSNVGEPLSLSLVEASMTAWSGKNAFNIGSDAAAEDLHLDLPALRRLAENIAARRAG